jgi:ABC-type transport system involved in cytochrome c biogenesis permease component
MTYLKSILVGILAAAAASLLYVLAVFVLPLLLPVLISRVTRSGGAAAASFSTGPLLGVALAAFAVGFYWEFRRASRTRRHAR